VIVISIPSPSANSREQDNGVFSTYDAIKSIPCIGKREPKTHKAFLHSCCTPSSSLPASLAYPVKSNGYLRYD
jgi:hypothetical protein